MAMMVRDDHRRKGCKFAKRGDLPEILVDQTSIVGSRFEEGAFCATDTMGGYK